MPIAFDVLIRGTNPNILWCGKGIGQSLHNIVFCLAIDGDQLSRRAKEVGRSRGAVGFCPAIIARECFVKLPRRRIVNQRGVTRQNVIYASQSLISVGDDETDTGTVG